MYELDPKGKRGALWSTGIALVMALSAGCAPPKKDLSTKVIVLGFDGMDPAFVRRHRDALPNLMRLSKQGGFADLQTVMPPQSPVAWSTVITGMTPGGHGIFDFVHRHPEDIAPYSSMAKAVPPEYTLEVGPWVIPLSSGETISLRKGRAFWEILADHDVPSWMLKMPTDFPPLPAAEGALSGMGTPDMLGTFGTFQFFTEDPSEFSLGEVSGGEIHRVAVVDNHLEAAILGPVNTFLEGEPRTRAPFKVDVDRVHGTARIEIGAETLVLNEGEWSGWIHLQFDLLPAITASGMVRLFLKQVDPDFKLYVSPVNIDPTSPEVTISAPPEYAAELAAAVGPFYTQGMAEETKGLSAHLLSREDFIEQAHIVFDEEIALYRHLLAGYEGGLLFYYFSTTDQAGHMLWGDHEAEMLRIYQKADEVVGQTIDGIDDETTLMVISDHGFARFDREVHLNRWLMEEGFLTLDDPSNVGDEPGFAHVDWSRTQAYAMGLNALYINRKGREAWGTVAPEDVEDVKDRISERLLAFTDPRDGARVVERVYDPQELFAGQELEAAPDLLVGFAPPYRMSNATGLGAVPADLVGDNTDEWIGDHCMAHDRVPGVLFSNRPILTDNPSLPDIPVTVLTAFGITPPSEMVGKNVLDFAH